MKYLLEELKAGARNTVERTFPNSDARLRIRLLTAQDILDSSIAADSLFKDKGVGVSVQNVRAYETEKEVQQLYRVCTDLDGNPLAPNISEFRKSLTVSDKDWLTAQYNELDERCNPSLETMSDADFDALVESVKKNPDTISSISSTATLSRLARFLASPPVALQTGNGSI